MTVSGNPVDTAAMILLPEVTDMTMATDPCTSLSPSPVLAKTVI